MTQMDLFQTATSSQQDTPASPFHLPGSVEAQKMTDISGHTYFPLFKPNDPLGAFSRMFMGTSLWASTKCYLTWSVKPTPQGRSLFQLAPQTLRTDATEFGSSPEMWATPDAAAGKRGGTLKRGKRPSGANRQVSINDQVKMWPTPRACSAMAAENIHNRVNDKNPNLETVVARTMWPTPTAHISKEGGYPSEYSRNTTTLTAEATISEGKPHSSGSLNPQWVEWLMGYPEGWTDLKD